MASGFDFAMCPTAICWSRPSLASKIVVDGMCVECLNLFIFRNKYSYIGREYSERGFESSSLIAGVPVPSKPAPLHAPASCRTAYLPGTVESTRKLSQLIGHAAGIVRCVGGVLSRTLARPRERPLRSTACTSSDKPAVAHRQNVCRKRIHCRNCRCFKVPSPHCYSAKSRCVQNTWRY